FARALLAGQICRSTRWEELIFFRLGHWPRRLSSTTCLPEQKLFLNLARPRRQWAREEIRLGLVAQWARQCWPALEQLDPRDLAPKATASNGRMTHWPVQPVVAPTDRAPRLPQEKVLLELAARQC